MTSKRISIIFFVVFLAGLGFFTLFSRWYIQVRKPVVQITFHETATLNWTYETRSTIEEAAPHFAVHGVRWTIEVYIPLSAFVDYMEAVYGLYAEAVSDAFVLPVQLVYLDRQALDDGGFIYIYSYESGIRDAGTDLPIWLGEGVTVYLAHRSLDVTADFYEFMVPLSAVHQDPFEGGNHIFSVHRRSGAWGWEYFVRRVDVELLLPNRIGDMANILPFGGYLTSPVVYFSESELYDGAVVRLWD